MFCGVVIGVCIGVLVLFTLWLQFCCCPECVLLNLYLEFIIGANVLEMSNGANLIPMARLFKINRTVVGKTREEFSPRGLLSDNLAPRQTSTQFVADWTMRVMTCSRLEF